MSKEGRSRKSYIPHCRGTASARYTSGWQKKQSATEGKVRGTKADVCLMSCTRDLSRYWYEYSAVQPCDGVSLVPTESDVPRRLLGYDLGRLFRMAEGTPHSGSLVSLLGSFSILMKIKK